MPGASARMPKNSTVVSLAQQTTGVPAASPVCPAASAVTPPAMAVGLTTGGRVAGSQLIRAQISGDQVFRPVIGHQRADHVAVIGLPCAGEAKAQVILGKIEPLGAGDGVGLVFLQPGQHGQRPGGVGAVERGGDDHAAGAGMQFGGFGGTALVVPHDGGADHNAFRIGEDRDMGAGGDADAGNGAGFDAGGGNGVRDRDAQGGEPFRGLLLRPAEMRDIGVDGALASPATWPVSLIRVAFRLPARDRCRVNMRPRFCPLMVIY